MSSSATGGVMTICFLGAILLILTQKSSQKFGDVLGIMVLDFIQTIGRTLGKHDQLGIANKMRRQPITTTLGKLYVVALFISHTHQGHSPTHLSFCTLHDSWPSESSECRTRGRVSFRQAGYTG